MRTFQLHILAADRVFFEGECESVVAPTASGQYGVQAHHSNMIAAISPGELTFRTAQGETRYAAVSAGMIKVEHNDVLILVDSAERPEDIDVVRAQREADEAREAILHRSTPPSNRRYWRTGKTYGRYPSRTRARPSVPRAPSPS